MKKEIKKFLEFNGKNIYFLAVDGVYWIAVKPICEALNIDEQKQYDFINKLQNEIDQLYAGQRIVDQKNNEKIISDQIMKAADGRMRKMVSISEEYVYGWIFQIQSPNNPDLLKYKLKCYQLLYNYFHGTITERENLLKAKTQADLEIETLELTLQNSKEYKRIQELKESQKKANAGLRVLDKKIVDDQYDLWHQEWVIKQEQVKTE